MGRGPWVPYGEMRIKNETSPTPLELRKWQARERERNEKTMSLRAEYSWHASYQSRRPQDLTSGWNLIVNHNGFQVGYEWVTNPLKKEEAANRLISAHMEKVTQMIEKGPPVVAQRSQFDPREDPTENES